MNTVLTISCFPLFSSFHSYVKMWYGTFKRRTPVIESDNPRWNIDYDVGEVSKSSHYRSAQKNTREMLESFCSASEEVHV